MPRKSFNIINKELSLSLLGKLLLIVLIGLADTVVAAEQQPIRLAAYDIPTLLQTDGEGHYDKIIALATTLAKAPWHYQVLPPARIDKLFELKKVDCIVPFDPRFHSIKNTLASDYMDIAKAYIFTAAGSEPLSSLKQLKDKKVGARNGMKYGHKLDNPDFRVEYVDSIEQNIDKLQAGRIDAFVAWMPDANSAFIHKGIAPLPHATPLLTHRDGFLCHNTEQAAKFIAQFNQALQTLKDKGVVQALLAQ